MFEPKSTLLYTCACLYFQATLLAGERLVLWPAIFRPYTSLRSIACSFSPQSKTSSTFGICSAFVSVGLSRAKPEWQLVRPEKSFGNWQSRSAPGVGGCVLSNSCRKFDRGEADCCRRLHGPRDSCPAVRTPSIFLRAIPVDCKSALWNRTNIYGERNHALKFQCQHRFKDVDSADARKGHIRTTSTSRLLTTELKPDVKRA